MEIRKLEKFVADEVALINALPTNVSIEPLELKAWEFEEVCKTVYYREFEKWGVTEYLDVFFKDGKSHVFIIVDSESFTLMVTPECIKSYKGNRFITVRRER